MQKNEDYYNGMRILLRECKTYNIDIHSYSWVCDLSMVLSWFGACHKFWSNVSDQHKLDRIRLCKKIEDIMFIKGKSLFTWDLTPEGGIFWHSLLLRDLFGKHLNEKVDDIRYLYGEHIYGHRLYERY